jgi:SCY1-like protein 1
VITDEIIVINNIDIDIAITTTNNNAGGNNVIKPIAQISEQLDEQDYHTLVAPAITRLFALPDRSIRMGLLENLGSFVQHLSSKVICNTIFPHYVSKTK